MPITITIEGSNADEIRQLVQDLAETIAIMRPEDVPVDTKISTLEPAPAGPVPTSPNAGAPAVPPVETVSAASGSAPVAPPTSAVPTAPAANSAPVAGAATPPVGQTIAPQAPAPISAPTTAPTSTPQYDFNQIASATMQLQQAGQNIFEIFQQFGIQALNQLPKERYAEYAAALRQRGAKI